jgi:hypothetical protein
MIVVTARSGEALRAYAKQAEGNKQVALFPEYGLSPTEQAGFLKANANRYIIVITFSPFIISDAELVNVLDTPEIDIDIKHGLSVNTINLVIWRNETIGDIALGRFNDLGSRLDKANSACEIQNVINDTFRQLGDSIERSTFIQKAICKKENFQS